LISGNLISGLTGNGRRKIFFFRLPVFPMSQVAVFGGLNKMRLIFTREGLKKTG